MTSDQVWGCSWCHICLISLKFSINVGMILFFIWYFIKKNWDDPVHHKQLISRVWKLMPNPVEQRKRTYKLDFFKAWLVTYFDIKNVAIFLDFDTPLPHVGSFLVLSIVNFDNFGICAFMRWGVWPDHSLSKFQAVIMLHWLVTVSVMMRPTMQTATLMVVTAVLSMQTQISVLIVNAIW